MFLGDVLCPI